MGPTALNLVWGLQFVQHLCASSQCTLYNNANMLAENRDQRSLRKASAFSLYRFDVQLDHSALPTLDCGKVATESRELELYIDYLSYERTKAMRSGINEPGMLHFGSLRIFVNLLPRVAAYPLMVRANRHS